MIKRSTVLVLLVALALSLTGASCPDRKAQQVVNVTSDVMVVVSSHYQLVQRTILDLNKAKTPGFTGEEFLRMDKINRQADVLMRSLWEKWNLLPHTNAALLRFVANKDFITAVGLVLQLAQYANLTDTIKIISDIQNEALTTRRTMEERGEI